MKDKARNMCFEIGDGVNPEMLFLCFQIYLFNEISVLVDNCDKVKLIPSLPLSLKTKQFRRSPIRTIPTEFNKPLGILLLSNHHKYHPHKKGHLFY